MTYKTLALYTKGTIGILAFISAIFNPGNTFAQKLNLGTPKIISFSPEDYKASPQNWDIEISSTGLIYITNNDGLLIYDGSKWALKALPNRTINRSLALSASDIIAVGGQDEIGLWLADKPGKLHYQSLLPCIPSPKRNLEDIWELVYMDSILIGRNTKSIFQIDPSCKFKIFHDDLNSSFISVIDNNIFYNDTMGIYRISEDGIINFVPGSEALANKEIVEILKIRSGEWLILTKEDGIYQWKSDRFIPWESNVQSFVKKNQLITGLILNNGNIALGTELGGLIIMDTSGKAIYKLDKQSGLQSNNINQIKEDEWGDLWLATRYGVDKIKMSNSLNFFYPDGDLEGAVYDIAFWNNHWWFGTANGLYALKHQEYYSPFDDYNFRFISSTAGQVWKLDIVNDKLLLGHHRGAFEVKKDFTLEAIGTLPGTWKFIRLSEVKIAIGTYEGVFIFSHDENDWKYELKIPDLNESSRIMIKDDISNKLWVSHPYRGLYSISFDPDYNVNNVEKHEVNEGYMTNLGNYIFNLFDTPYLVNDNGVFRYQYGSKSFVMDDILSEKLQNSGKIRRFKQYKNSIWYISEKETGEIIRDTKGLTLEVEVKHFPDLNGFYVGGFENLHVMDERNLFLCTNKGVYYKYDPFQPKSNQLEAYISGLHLLDQDSVLLSNHYSRLIKPTLASAENHIEIQFRTNGASDQSLDGYSHMLEGREEGWSPFHPKPSREFDNLPPGDYTFLLRAKDKSGNVSPVTSLSFKVLAPWYLTVWAKASYAMMSLVFILSLILGTQKKFRKTKAELVTRQKETEEEMEAIKQEKLQNEIQFKNKELASSTLHLLQKNQTLNKLREELETLKKNVKDSQAKKGIHNIVNLLRSDLRMEDDWEKFSLSFDQVHQNFIQRLQKDFPNLSTNDHKLCAYLKMNLSTKEIAPLLNISVRGVEISRYRLRKKLGINKEVNLNEFMNQF